MIRATALALVASAVLGSASAQQPTVADPAPAARTPRAKPAPRAFTHKPTAPIGVSYELSGEPALGQPLTIRIVARPGPGVGAVTLDVRSAEDLAIGSVVDTAPSTPSERVWTVTITPLGVAAAHLNIFVTGLLNGEPQTRSLTIPIRVAGAKPVPGNAAVKADESGEAIVALPAEER